MRLLIVGQWWLSGRDRIEKCVKVVIFRFARCIRSSWGWMMGGDSLCTLVFEFFHAFTGRVCFSWRSVCLFQCLCERRGRAVHLICGEYIWENGVGSNNLLQVVSRYLASGEREGVFALDSTNPDVTHGVNNG